MTKADIQADAKTKFPDDKMHYARQIWIDGVLSDTARKHWEPKWIPVTERLPNPNECVMCLWSPNAVNEHHPEAITIEPLIDSEGFLKGAVTHWMPLPTPPPNQ